MSNQSFVCDGVGYNEVFPLSQKDLDTSSEERNPSATSPSSRDEGLKMDRPEDDSSNGFDSAEPPIQSVIGLDELREFIMLPIWTINDFTSSIKESHFKTLGEKYQIPVNIPLCLPYKSEKCSTRASRASGSMSRC